MAVSGVLGVAKDMDGLWLDKLEVVVGGVVVAGWDNDLFKEAAISPLLSVK